MKIWFDISNAPHINLFKDLIKELESEGHEIVVTCRPLSNTVSLLDLHNIKYTIIGKHYGKNFLKKILGYPIGCGNCKNLLNHLGWMLLFHKVHFILRWQHVYLEFLQFI